MRCFLIGCCLLSFSFGVQAQDLPADLGHVPGNAIGFVHIRTADLWKTPWFKMYRDILPRAGAEALAVLEDRIVPSLSSIDRVTVVAFAKPNPQRAGEPEFAVLIHLTKPLDEKKFLAGLEEKNAGQVRFYSLRENMTVQILDKTTLMMGSQGAPFALAEGTKVSVSFREALAVAASGRRAIVAAFNPSIIPPQVLAGLPPMVQPFARAKTFLVSVDLGDKLTLEADMSFADADQAKEAEAALEQARQLGRALLDKTKAEMRSKLAQGNTAVPLYDVEKVAEIVGPVFALAMLKRAEEILDAIPVTRQQEHVSLKVAVPEELTAYVSSGPILIALLLPAVQKVREAASRTQDANNLKQIGIAVHSYHDAFRHLPPAAICAKNGKPLLSWRVAILPYIEEQDLYSQFKLDEPWDSDHNKPLLRRMPPVYKMSGAPPSDTDTHYRVLVGPAKGPSALFRTYSEKPTFASIRDGTSNTLMIVESEDAVPWTKPDELNYDPKGDLPRFSRLRAGFQAAFSDGSVRLLANTIPAETLRALITRDGGEPFNLE